MTQMSLFAGPAKEHDGDGEWRCDVPPTAKEQGLHESLGRGGYLIMARAKGDPEDAVAGKRGGGESAHALRRWRKSAKPTEFMDDVEKCLYAELGGTGQAMTLHAIGLRVLGTGKGGDVTAGSPLEEALWLCVKHKSVRWRVRKQGHGHVIEFAAWCKGARLQSKV